MQRISCNVLTQERLRSSIGEAFICCKENGLTIAVNAIRAKCAVAANLPASPHLSSLTLETSNALLSPLGSHLEPLTAEEDMLTAAECCTPNLFRRGVQMQSGTRSRHSGESANPTVKSCDGNNVLPRGSHCRASARTQGIANLPIVLDEGCW
jgi:hypothetical protein